MQNRLSCSNCPRASFNGIDYVDLPWRINNYQSVRKCSLTIQFTKSLANTFQKSFNCIEGCYCAISVKSTLDKGALYNSLENLATIPNDKQLNLNPDLIVSPEFLSQIPLKIIFAFKGDKVEYIERLIEEYQTQNSDVNIPNLIIVNNSFLIEKIGLETRRYPNGNPIAPGSLIAMSSSKYIEGIAHAYANQDPDHF